MRKLLMLCLMLLVPTAARADWMQASSDHFVVYGNMNEKGLQQFSEQLERYHAALAKVTGRANEIPSLSNRVTIYVVGTEYQVEKLFGSDGIGGFYTSQAGASSAFVQRTKPADDGFLDFTMVVLLHEYTHHFMIASTGFPAPRWMQEGMAEFYSSAFFDSDGSVRIGRPNIYRTGELVYAQEVSVLDLLDPDEYKKRHGNSGVYNAFYGKSWLLYHYLVFNKKREGQLKKYLSGLISGQSSRDAGLAAFGDLGALDRELASYFTAMKPVLKVPATDLTIGKVGIRPLSGGEAAIMPIVMRSRRGADEKRAEQIAQDARTIAAKFPTDAAVQAALSEAEHDAGHEAEAIAAADTAIAADKGQVNAYVQKGLALYSIALKKPDPVAFRAARAPFLELNAIEHDHPLPLVFNYLTRKAQGAAVSDLAVQGLHRAAQLAPFDLRLRMLAAKQALQDKYPDLARTYLVPVAYNPHADKMSELARSYIERIDKDPNWAGGDLPDDPAEYTKKDDEKEKKK